MASDLVVQRSEDGLLHVEINRPESLNALSTGVLSALAEAFNKQAGDKSLRVAILTSAGEKSFASGGDLRELSTLRDPEEVELFSRGMRKALNAIRLFPVPVVGALNGDAIGGGAELALACDFRVMSGQARIGFLQGKLNITTAWGGGIDLMTLLGRSRALELLCSSRMVGAAEARAMGLADAAAEADQPFTEVLDAFVTSISSQKPHVLRGFKRQAIAERMGLPRQGREDMETEDFKHAWLHDDHWAASDAFLARKRR